MDYLATAHQKASPRRFTGEAMSYSGIERRKPEPTVAQIAESERRSDYRFAAVPVRHTAMGDLL